MIHVIAFIHVKEGRVPEFIEIFKANIPHVQKEKGCIDYISTIDISTGLPPQQLEENVVTIIGKWESLEDLRVHLVAPHMLAYREKVNDIVEKVVLKVLRNA